MLRVCAQGVRKARIYNAAMNKSVPRRHLRRTALWVAFAALAGFLLADLT
ncbi:hypothetical protein D8I24_5932 [Cupriavidus necator H850]|nr:hypothetical protein D8I24_5932 [Cupriavidus necator H850]